MEKKESKFKSFVKEHKAAIAATIGIAVGATVGGVAVYAKTEDARKLWDLLGEYDRYHKVTDTLKSKIFQYASAADRAKHLELNPGCVKTVAEFGECVNTLMEACGDDGSITDEIVGAVIFTKYPNA